MAKMVEEILWCYSFFSGEQAVIAAGILISQVGYQHQQYPSKETFKTLFITFWVATDLPWRSTNDVGGEKSMGFATRQISVQIPAPLLIWWVTLSNLLNLSEKYLACGKNLVKSSHYHVILMEYDGNYRFCPQEKKYILHF